MNRSLRGVPCPQQAAEDKYLSSALYTYVSYSRNPTNLAPPLYRTGNPSPVFRLTFKHWRLLAGSVLEV
jgi:hypothetical protein